MEAGLEETFRKYSPMVYRVCLRYLDGREEAEDITQEIFLKLNGNLSRFRGESQVSTWIYRITVNSCLDFLRMRRRRESLAGEYLGEVIRENSCDNDGPAEAKATLKQVLENTHPDIRHVLFLTMAEGLSYDEAGQVCGKTKAAIAKIVSRFRKTLILRKIASANRSGRRRAT